MSISNRDSGFVEDGPRLVLRAEALAVLFASCFAFAFIHGNWWLFAALFFVPDISFVAYWSNPRVGAAAYNLFHSYVSPFGLAGAALLTHTSALLSVAVIWCAHIGFDRALGYGLKYSTAFGDTHLGHLGNAGRLVKNADAA